MWRQADTDGTIEATIRIGELDKDGEPAFNSERQKTAITNLLDAWNTRFMKAIQVNMKKKK